ncbi:hypothetical protein SeMB42_g07262 [Synchytrium endobioticum]|uniref:Protein kinase domain-containing protein n=1 Tax=Synchytrium endobioticum TaxID=286115 RepID=A0A507CB84_9FUNG|nr:hypothetical protein SeMB42_g07262 [Synchytrium endobioticum]TPX43334.1 hypothetical protein SeLEV6574_g05120 [Synchytrium endobioticum]
MSLLKRTASVNNTHQPDEADLHISMNYADYELGPPIGYGSSAVVYQATYKPLQRHVAIKLIELDQFERNQIEELRKEIQIMSLCKHSNLLRVYGSFVHDSKLYIVTPFLSAGSCLDIMKTAYPDGMDEAAIATILKHALLGLEYLHANKLIHRDVKAGNLLMSGDGIVQLADFGVSISLSDTGERKGVRKTFVGTPCWMAPEVMEQNGYDYKADIWSFGITALELANGHAPFAKYPPLKVLMLTLQQDPPTLDIHSAKHKYTKTFKEMIDSCLQKDPTKRPTPEKLLQHSFFKNNAKKPNYLATTLLQSLPPISQRPHNSRPPQPPKFDHRGIVWDFTDDDAEKIHENHATFSSGSSQNSTVSSRPDITLPALKKIATNTSNCARSSGAAMTIDSISSSSGAAPTAVSTGAAPVKKSRFVIDTCESSSPSTTYSISPGMTPLSDIASSSICSNHHNHVVEIKKGRFSVSEVSSDDGRPSDASSQLAAVNSPENMGLSAPQTPPAERKSRFAVQELPDYDATHHQASPSHALAPSEKRSRFEITSELLSSPTYSNGSINDTHSMSSSPSASPYSSLRRMNDFVEKGLHIQAPPQQHLQ